MPVYSYAGLSPDGKNVSGIIDADSARAARLKLRRSGVFPTSVTESAVAAEAPRAARSLGRWFERVGPQELAVVTRQLSTLISAGLPLVDCLSALIDQADSQRLKGVLTQTRERVNEGSSLADALSEHPKIFSDLYINMVRAGEASGALDVVLLRLADYTESSARLRSKLRAALTYPTIMLVLGATILFFLLSYVVPRITRIFAESKQVLPLPTRLLMAVSGAFAAGWPLLVLGGAVAAIGLRAYLRTPNGRYRYDRWRLRVPVFGKLQQKIAVARFSRTLSTLLQSGIGLLPSLDIVKNIVDNRVLFDATEAARDAIREGQSIAPPLRKSGIFPPLMIHMIAVGERSGRLEEMLFKTAETYEGEVDNTIATLTTLLEPAMIVFMGALVTFIVLSILLPILQMGQLIR
ncbi:MAG: type II secretion system inner membrane protein GspF [Deltaproteobacteria bacterium]|nr:type II secretion system inner membrane protein GspF [Deltaproteobacteria bacterium]